MDEIISQVVAAIIKDHGEALKLVSATQACGILDVTYSTLMKMEIPRVDVSGKGRNWRWRLSDIEAALVERTIKPFKRQGIGRGRRRL